MTIGRTIERLEASVVCGNCGRDCLPDGDCYGCGMDRAEAEAARLRDGLRRMEDSALKAAQLLPLTLSTSVEADHRDDHSSWAGWLLRHKVLPIARALLAEEKA